jgi:hypothetical protein
LISDPGTKFTKEQDATLPLEPHLRNAATDFRCLDDGRARTIEEFVSIGENESSFADSSQLNTVNISSPQCQYLVSVKAADDFPTPLASNEAIR